MHSSVCCTRMKSKSSSMPEAESLKNTIFARQKQQIGCHQRPGVALGHKHVITAAAVESIQLCKS
jgi:hypothetical protein